MRAKSVNILITILITLCTTHIALADEVPVQTLQQVYQLVVSKNSGLEAIRNRSRGVRALIKQANRIPNPELVLESENFGGDRNDFDESENTFAVSQVVELGGKRSARTALATSESQLFEAKAKANLATLLGEVQIAYSNAVLSQTTLTLAMERSRFTQDILKTVQEKVRLGGILAGEETKAKIAVQVARIDQQKAENAHQNNKRTLASLWNGTAIEVGNLEGSARQKREDSLVLPELKDFPKMQVRSLQIIAARRSLERERAQAIPDLTLSGGYRRFEETDDGAFVAGLSIPLPVFNRNQGNISQASSEVNANEAELQRDTVATKAELDSLLQLRSVLKQERAIIRSSLLPNSKKGLEQIQEAYRLGRVGYLDLIDSQEVYFDTRVRAAENLFSLSSNEAKLRVLTGTILSDFQGAMNEK